VANSDFVRINALLDQVKRDNAISIVISWTPAHNNAESFLAKLNVVPTPRDYGQVVRLPSVTTHLNSYRSN